MLSLQRVLFNNDCNKFSMHTYIPKAVCLFSWFNSAPFIQLSDQRVKTNITKFFIYSLLHSLLQMTSCPNSPKYLDVSSPLHFAYKHTHTHTHTCTITHITGICRIITMKVLTFFLDYLDHQLHNSNQLYTHLTLYMYRCDDKRHFSLNASLHTSQT